MKMNDVRNLAGVLDKGCCSRSKGIVIETDLFKDVLDHIAPSTIIFSDLDNTLMESSQYYGSIQWEEDYQKQQCESGEPHEVAWTKAHHLWVETLPRVSMRLVDESIPEVIQEIINQKSVFLGLTARPPEVAALTFSQLDLLGIYFDKRFNGHNFLLKNGTSFEDGIIFCDRINKKSEVLLQFLNSLDTLPNRIIFIDDKISHVKDIESALTKFNIDYIGIRFSIVDQRFKSCI